MWKATPLEEATLPCALPYLEGHAPEEVPPLEEATPRNTTWSWPESPRAGAQLGDCNAVLVDLERKRGDLARRGVKGRTRGPRQGGRVCGTMGVHSPRAPQLTVARVVDYTVQAAEAAHGLSHQALRRQAGVCPSQGCTPGRGSRPAGR